MRFLNNVDLEGNELRSAVIETLNFTQTVKHLKEGRIWFDEYSGVVVPISGLSFAGVGRVAVGIDTTDPGAAPYPTPVGTGPFPPETDRLLAYLDDVVYAADMVRKLTTGNVFVGVGGTAADTPKKNVPISDWGFATDHVDMGNKTFKIVNLADPSADYDAVNKRYADSLRSGLLIKEACDLATAVPLVPAWVATANPGLNGFLDGAVVGALIVDGVPVAVNDRILVKDEVPNIAGGANANVGAAMNGIWIVQIAGDSYTKYRLKRASDCDNSSPSASVKQGIQTSILGGQTNAATQWVLFTADPITLNTTYQQWNLTYQTQDLTPGKGLIIPAGTNQMDVDPSPKSGTVLGFYDVPEAPATADPLLAQLGILRPSPVQSGVIVQKNSITAPAISATYPSWITTATDGHVLRRTSGDMVFGFVAWGELTGRPTWIGVGTTPYSVIGNPKSPAALPSEITVGAIAGVTVPSATGDARPILFCHVPATGVGFNYFALTDLPDIDNLSVLGRAINNPVTVGTKGDVTVIAVGASPTPGYVLKVRDIGSLGASNYTLGWDFAAWGEISGRPASLTTLAARTVVGNPASGSTTVPALIQGQGASTFLRDSGTALAFTRPVWADLGDVPVLAAKTVLGNYTNATVAAPLVVAASILGTVLKDTGTALAFGFVAWGELTSRPSALISLPARTVVGNPTNALVTTPDLVTGQGAGTFLKDTGTSLVFSAIAYGDLSATLAGYSVLGNRSAPLAVPGPVTATPPANATLPRPILLCNVAGTNALGFNPFALSDLPQTGDLLSVVARKETTDGACSYLGPAGDFTVLLKRGPGSSLEWGTIPPEAITYIKRTTINIPAGTTTIVLSHNFGRADVMVALYENALSPYETVYADIDHTSLNTATVKFGAATINAINAVIIG